MHVRERNHKIRQERKAEPSFLKAMLRIDCHVRSQIPFCSLDVEELQMYRECEKVTHGDFGKKNETAASVRSLRHCANSM
jgi:hypothetical protein